MRLENRHKPGKVICDLLESRRLLSAVNIVGPVTSPAGFTAGEVTGVAVGNINGDNLPDIVLTQESSASVLFFLGTGVGGNLSSPSTVYTTGDGPVSPVIADMNGDHIGDIVVADVSLKAVSVLFNDGDNHFNDLKNFTVGNSPDSVAVADFDNNQSLDMVAANTADDTVSVLLNSGNETFQSQTTFDVGDGPISVATGDFNKDGNQDIAVANITDDTVSVLLGNGKGTFKDQMVFAVGASPQSLTVADFNGDGNPDIVVANSGSDSVSVLLGKGNGKFAPFTTYDAGRQPQSLVVADFNNDGKLDIATLSTRSQTHQIAVLLGKGNGNFQPQSNVSPDPYALALAVGNINPGSFPTIVTSNSLNTLSLMYAEAVAPAPKLLSPANAGVTAASPVLKFTTTGEYPKTRIIITTDRKQLPTDPASNDSVPNAVLDLTTGNSGSYTVSSKLVRPNTTYYWEAQDVGGGVGLFSAIRSFSTPDTKPAIKPLANALIQAGQTFAAPGSFTDNDAGDSWSATVTYGDGSKTTRLALNGRKFALSHRYSKIGNFQITVSITDSHGVTGVDKFHVNVIKPINSVAFAQWTSPTTGKLGALTYTLTSSRPNTPALFSADLSTSDFSIAKGSATQQTLEYYSNDAWTITFSAAVPRLLLDAKFWRGTAGGAPPMSTANYTFNKPFTIISGLGGTKASGNTLMVPSEGFFDGIIEFDNIKTLTVTTNLDQATANVQLMTFSLAK